MKKFISTLTAVLLCVIMGAACVGCNNNGGGTTPEPKDLSSDTYNFLSLKMDGALKLFMTDELVDKDNAAQQKTDYLDVGAKIDGKIAVHKNDLDKSLASGILTLDAKTKPFFMKDVVSGDSSLKYKDGYLYIDGTNLGAGKTKEALSLATKKAQLDALIEVLGSIEIPDLSNIGALLPMVQSFLLTLPFELRSYIDAILTDLIGLLSAYTLETVEETGGKTTTFTVSEKQFNKIRNVLKKVGPAFVAATKSMSDEYATEGLTNMSAGSGRGNALIEALSAEMMQKNTDVRKDFINIDTVDYYVEQLMYKNITIDGATLEEKLENLNNALNEAGSPLYYVVYSIVDTVLNESSIHNKTLDDLFAYPNVQTSYDLRIAQGIFMVESLAPVMEMVKTLLDGLVEALPATLSLNVVSKTDTLGAINFLSVKLATSADKLYFPKSLDLTVTAGYDGASVLNALGIVGSLDSLNMQKSDLTGDPAATGTAYLSGDLSAEFTFGAASAFKDDFLGNLDGYQDAASAKQNNFLAFAA